MKPIIAILALVLFAFPSLALAQNNKRPPASKIHLWQIEQRRDGYRSVHWFAHNSFQPAFPTHQNEQALCSTAHDFCPNFHGDND
jgi:hypothetical protein